MRTILTPDDLKKGDLLDPGWYTTQIESYKEEVVKGTPERPSDGSMNGTFFFKVINNKNEKFNGVVVKRLFNEKALGFGQNLWIALELPNPTNTGAGSKEEGFLLDSQIFEQAVGSIVEVYVKRGKSDAGREFNDVQDFRKAKVAQAK